MNKTIYVRDEQLWLKGRLLAKELNISMSELIERALREYIQRRTW